MTFGVVLSSTLAPQNKWLFLEAPLRINCSEPQMFAQIKSLAKTAWKTQRCLQLLSEGLYKHTYTHRGEWRERAKKQSPQSWRNNTATQWMYLLYDLELSQPLQYGSLLLTKIYAFNKSGRNSAMWICIQTFYLLRSKWNLNCVLR